MKKKSGRNRRSNSGILQVEILIERINMLLAKSVYFSDEEAIQELERLRHKIYYEDFDYQTILSRIDELKKRTIN